MGNLRHKRAKKLAQVYMASEGQGWDRNLCLHPIVLGVGRANTTADGKVLGRLQGALAQEVLLMRPLLDAGPQTGPGATFYHPLSITSSSFPAGMGVGAGSQNNRRSKEKVQACWVFAGADPSHFTSCPSFSGARGRDENLPGLFFLSLWVLLLREQVTSTFPNLPPCPAAPSAE